MFAIIAAIVFGVALLLNLIGTQATWVTTLVIAGLLSLALYHAIGTAITWRRP